MHGVYPRAKVAATATTANRWRDLRMTDRTILLPSDTVAVISYRADVTRADGEPYSAFVSSGYVQRDDAWKLMFHQHAPL